MVKFETRWDQHLKSEPKTLGIKNPSARLHEINLALFRHNNNGNLRAEFIQAYMFQSLRDCDAEPFCTIIFCFVVVLWRFIQTKRFILYEFEISSITPSFFKDYSIP